MEGGKIRIRGDPEIQVHPLYQGVQVLQRVLVNIRKDLSEELFQELQVGSKASCRTAAALTGLVIIQCSDDVEGIQTPELGITYVYDLSMQVMGQLGILVLRVQDEYLGILGGQVHKQ